MCNSKNGVRGKLRVLSPRASMVVNNGNLLRFWLRAMGLGEYLAVREKRVHLLH